MLVTLTARLIVVGASLLVASLIEPLAWAERVSPRRSVRFNLFVTAIFWTFHVAIGATVISLIADAAGRLPGHGLLPLLIPVTAPWWLVGLGALLWVSLRDFWYYWFHRLQHAWPVLWVQHELHHSDPCVNATTAWRHHWLEFPLEAIFVIAPFTYVVTAPTRVVVWGVIVGETMAYFIHLNARWSLGAVIASPQTHRIHHSTADAHLDKNFAAICPLWDVLFGTYYAPQKGEYPTTGLRSGQVPTWRQAIIGPLYAWLGR